MKITDGVYAYIWKGVFENNCNMYYFGGPLNILFDTGLKRHMDLRFDAMKKDGIDPENIKYVVNTHSHPDHFEGAEYFMKKGIPAAMHKDEIQFINEEGPRFFAMMGMTLPKFNFDIVLGEGKWKVGDIELEIYHTPGHSPGSVCIYWREKKTLVCGDLVFKESVGRVDFPGGSAARLKESIAKISELDIEYLLPGHMDYISGAGDVKKNFDLIKRYIFSQL